MLASLISCTLFATLALAVKLVVPDTIKQCDKITFGAYGAGNLNVAVLRKDDECGDSIKEWTNVKQGDDFTYTAALKAGTVVTFLVEENDSDAEEWSDPITITAGDCDCLPDGCPAGSLSASSTGTKSANNFAPSPSQTQGGNGGVKNVANDPNPPSSAARVGASLLVVAGAVVAALL